MMVEIRQIWFDDDTFFVDNKIDAKNFCFVIFKDFDKIDRQVVDKS